MSLKNGDLKPSDITAYNNRKVWWKCANGHSYCSKVVGRTVKGCGCPICARLKRCHKVLNVDTGEIFADSMMAAQSIGASNNKAIRECCLGRIKTVGGYHWMYIEN